MAENENVPSNPTPDSSVKVKGKKLDVQLPYLSSPGTVKTALDRIRQAAAPERVHLDFVNTILKMKGGSGAAVIPFLKKVGLVATDGSPTDLYKRFRNPSTGGAAIASAIKHGYKSLAESREYFYKLEDKELLNLIVEVTGAEPNSSTAKQIFYTLKALRNLRTSTQSKTGWKSRYLSLKDNYLHRSLSRPQVNAKSEWA